MKKFSFLLLFGTSLLGITITQSCKSDGCTDPVAENYDEKAREDNGTCTYIEGCTDELAVNYDSNATVDDGSCDFEFIADNATFSGFLNWTLEGTYNGADPSLGEAHGGNNDTTIREVFFLDGQDPIGGVYPVGTVIVKYTTLSTGDKEITAMVKRGNGFDSPAGDWEYFLLNEDGTIELDGEARGADLFGGNCKSCHSFATTDHVFSK